MISIERADSDQNGMNKLPIEVPALKFRQSQENYVCDQEKDCRWPEDSMETHCAIETAKNRL